MVGQACEVRLEAVRAVEAEFARVEGRIRLGLVPAGNQKSSSPNQAFYELIPAPRRLWQHFGVYCRLGNCHDHTPCVRGMLDQFMGACYLIERNDRGNVESLPASLKCLW